MRYVAIIISGLLWAAIAGIIAGLADLKFVAAIRASYGVFVFPAILTSALVTFLFRRRLFTGSVSRDFILPISTIATSIPIFSVILFCSFMIRASFQPVLGSPFDGALGFVVSGEFLALTIALPLTYPAAYLTQVFVGAVGVSHSKTA